MAQTPQAAATAAIQALLVFCSSRAKGIRIGPFTLSSGTAGVSTGIALFPRHLHGATIAQNGGISPPPIEQTPLIANGGCPRSWLGWLAEEDDMGKR
jgi:hypothetical protein